MFESLHVSNRELRNYYLISRVIPVTYEQENSLNYIIVPELKKGLP